jgi:quercetin dioxygenase-like cupin family protein
MVFEKKGDTEIGHKHPYHHGTMLSSGSLLVKTEKGMKIFNAPSLIFIDKDLTHELIALEDNTVANCIHALRDVEGALIPPETIPEGVDVFTDREQFDHFLLEKGIIGIKTMGFDKT